MTVGLWLHAALILTALGSPASMIDRAALLAGQEPPEIERRDVEPWLGVYTSDAETIAFTWQDGLRFRMDLIEIPVDGLWHETVSTFAVRHRARWLPPGEVVIFQEQHNYVALDERADGGWHYEFRLNRPAGEIRKVLVRSGTETPIRVYRRDQ